MEKLAKKIAAEIFGGEVFLLSGVLGAGKTFFSGLLAKHLGVEAQLTSPTFSLCREYRYLKDGEPRKIFHFDLYRLNLYSQLKELAFEDILKDKEGLVLIEWPECVNDVTLEEKIRTIAPERTIYRMEIYFADNLKDREIILETT